MMPWLLCMFGLARADMDLKTKNKTVPINIIIAPEYTTLYEQTHSSLIVTLDTIAASVESSFNNSPLARKNGYEVLFDLLGPTDNPVAIKIDSSTCEGAITNITSLLNDVNNEDNQHHYILMVPCSPESYKEIFDSVNSSVPILESRINVECAKRLVVFYDPALPKLMSAFGNALLRTLGASLTDVTTVDENSMGDKGLTLSINLKDSTVYTILHDPCFQNLG